MASRIAIVYIIIGCFWILLGDTLLGKVINEEGLTAGEINAINITKGIVYVLLTGLALFFYIRQSLRSRKNLEFQYLQLFKDNPNPMWVYDAENLKILDVNKVAENAYGYSREEFLQLTIKDLRPPEDLKLLEKTLALKFNENFNLGVFRHLRKDGSLFYVNIYSSPTLFLNKKARTVVAMDVSEKEFAEQQIVKLSLDLGEYKNRLEKILENSNDVVWSCNPFDFSISYISNACKSVYGYSPEDFYTGKVFWLNTTHPNDIALKKQAIDILFEKGKHAIEYRIVRSDGSIRTLYDKASITYDENGKPKEITGVATDITELRQSEQKLESYSKYIAGILDGISDGFFALDKESRFTYVNNVFKSMTAKQENELLGKVVWDLYPQFQDTAFHQNLIESKEKKVTTHFEIQYFENQRWYLCTIYPNAEGVAMYFSDITETRQMNEEVLRTKNNLRALINNTQDLIWSIDTNYEFISFNQAYRDLVGLYSQLEVKEGSLSYSLELDEHGKFRSRWLKLYERGLRGEYFTTEEKLNFKETGYKIFEVSFNPIKDLNGEVVGLGCFGRDITEINKKTQQISKQNEKLIEISWMQSHEVRGPLSSLMGLVNYMKENTLSNQELEQILEMLSQAANKLDNIVENIVKKSVDARTHEKESLSESVEKEAF